MKLKKKIHQFELNKKFIFIIFYLGFSWLGSAPVTLWCNATKMLAIGAVAYVPKKSDKKKKYVTMLYVYIILLKKVKWILSRKMFDPTIVVRNNSHKRVSYHFRREFKIKIIRLVMIKPNVIQTTGLTKSVDEDVGMRFIVVVISNHQSIRQHKCEDAQTRHVKVAFVFILRKKKERKKKHTSH